MAPLSPDRAKKGGGLTLAEVLMAVGILAMVLIFVIGVFIGGLNLMERSEVHTDASSIGRELLETIEDEGGFAALPSDDVIFDGKVPTPRVDGFPPEPYPVAQRGREYTIRVEVRKPPGGERRLGAVLVTVSWDDGGRGESRIELEKVFHASDSVL